MEPNSDELKREWESWVVMLLHRARSLLSNAG